MKKHSLDFYKKMPVKKVLSVVGIPFEEGSGATGLRTAPGYLRKCGLVKKLKNSGLDVLDCGDVLISKSKSRDKMEIKKNAILMAEIAAKKVEKEFRSGRRVLTIGGDHSISLGSIAGASAAHGNNIALIWIDAHPDICTWEESLSKNIHGMQAAALMGVGDSELVNVYKKGIKIKKENVIFLGLKDMDDYEREYIKKEKIEAVTMFDIEKKGMIHLFSILEKFLEKHKNVWVSLDMDSVAKQYVPSSPMATNEGFTAREISTILRFIGRTANVLGGDIVEFSSKGDDGKKTAGLAIDLAAKMFGSDAGWYEEYMEREGV